ncbi:Hsp20 family protein, partial [Negativicoccus succinicivorans]
TAEHKNSNEKKDDEGHIIRQERYYGNTKRSFYVGDAVTKEDIQAKYDKGVLNIFVPK